MDWIIGFSSFLCPVQYFDKNGGGRTSNLLSLALSKNIFTAPLIEKGDRQFKIRVVISYSPVLYVDFKPICSHA